MFILNRNKVIQELLTLTQVKEVREGEFAVTVTGGFARTSIVLSIQVPERAALPMSGVPAQDGAAPQQDRAAPTVRTFQTTSYFLRECHRQLFTDNHGEERQLLISGASLPHNSHWLDICVAVKLKNASAVGVEADLSDLVACLAELDDGHGLLLTGIFHSHLWRGRGAVNPSGTDRALQANLEASGYKTVQGIFSVDGFCGFFTNDVPFRLEVLDTGWEEVETHEHQTVVWLTHASQVSDQALQTPKPAGAPLYRPAGTYPRL